MLRACMRMICDTPAILDPTRRISPKLEELERILGDLPEEPDRKVIVFSEWETMLGMVHELAGEMGIEAAWHTGSLPQQRRRAEIVRFKQDPACRLFLSTDSGSVGLNLEVASAVVNVDLPWNPAKLEQRIARAWRKSQMRGVTVASLGGRAVGMACCPGRLKLRYIPNWRPWHSETRLVSSPLPLR